MIMTSSQFGSHFAKHFTTQADAALCLRTDRSNISRYLSGHTAVPGPVETSLYILSLLDDEQRATMLTSLRKTGPRFPQAFGAPSTGTTVDPWADDTP
jgi:hypothetical protein